MTRWYAAATVLAVAAYLAALVLGWAVVDGSARGFFELIGRSSAVTVFLCVMYLLLTLVALGLAAATSFSPPLARWYAAGALLAAVLDLAATAAVAYRILDANLGLGLGWYAAALATVAAAVAAAGAVAAKGL